MEYNCHIEAELSVKICISLFRERRLDSVDTGQCYISRSLFQFNPKSSKLVTGICRWVSSYTSVISVNYTAIRFFPTQFTQLVVISRFTNVSVGQEIYVVVSFISLR